MLNKIITISSTFSVLPETDLSRDARNGGDAVLPKDIDRHHQDQLKRELLHIC